MKSPLTRASIAVLICAASLIAYVGWYSTIKEKSATVASLQAEIDAKSQTATRVAAARATLLRVAGDEAIVRNFFVSETGIVSFIEDLEARGRLQNATVTVLSVSKETGGKHTVLILSVSIKGTFDAIMRTIGSIEYAPYDLVLSSVALDHPEKEAWGANIRIRVGSTAPGTATTTKP